MSDHRNEDSELVLLITDAEKQFQDRLVQFGAANTTTKRDQWVRYARVLSACVFVAAAGFTLAQPNCVVQLFEHVYKHAGAGALFAAYQLWCKAGKHTPNVAGSVLEFRKDVVHSSKEGVLAGLASAMLEML